MPFARLPARAAACVPLSIIVLLCSPNRAEGLQERVQRRATANKGSEVVVDDLRVVKSFPDLNHGEVPPGALDCLFVTLQNAPEYSGRPSGE
jgi:hypothetical protein